MSLQRSNERPRADDLRPEVLKRVPLGHVPDQGVVGQVGPVQGRNRVHVGAGGAVEAEQEEEGEEDHDGEAAAASKQPRSV